MMETITPVSGTQWLFNTWELLVQCPHSRCLTWGLFLFFSKAPGVISGT